jgi:archaellum biogenesis protein FlaJ (TadC family)
MFAGLEGWVEGLGLLAVFSVLTFAGSLLVIPLVAARIPADYFCAERRGKTLWRKRRPGLRMILLILKNMLGLVLFLAGVLMLFLPGQGLLTIFLGIMLMDFPGKYRLERYIISRGPVLRGINWFRKRSGVAPLEVMECDDLF